MNIRIIKDKKIQIINWDNIIAVTLEPYQAFSYSAPSTTHCSIIATTIHPDEIFFIAENIPVEEGIELMEHLEKAITDRRKGHY